ncbi:hypothetical protein [Thermococcus gammatolerans]|uniref:hypothetical protein n=1 Tax=Thermococcus gammatolerans TaxID=187878 RepID=UPI0011D17AE1|nr:hypothetical protein [Thermococcus gammatolerans]
MPKLLKARYVGFRSPLTAMLDHVDADFTLYEEVGEVSVETCKLIRKVFGRSYLTLDDLPGVLKLKLPGRDREVLMRALSGLKPDEKLKLERG